MELNLENNLHVSIESLREQREKHDILNKFRKSNNQRHHEDYVCTKRELKELCSSKKMDYENKVIGEVSNAA